MPLRRAVFAPEFQAGISGVSPTCPRRRGRFASSSWRGASVVAPFYVAGASSQSALRAVFWRRGHGERPGLTMSSITSGWPWAGRPAASFAQRLMLPVSNDTRKRRSILNLFMYLRLL